MADASLSIATSITEVIASTATTKSLTFDIRDAPEDIVDLRVELQNLSSLLRSAQDVIVTHRLRTADTQVVSTVRSSILRCQSALEAIQAQLKLYLAKNSGRRSPMRAISWTFHKGEVRNLRTRLRDSEANLQLAITIMIAHTTGRDQERIKVEMAAGYSSLASVNGAGDRLSSFASLVDAELPIRRYFEEYHNATSLAPPTLYEGPEPAENVPPADPNATFEDIHPIFRSVQTGNAQMLLVQLSLGASPNERFRDGRTPLHFCARDNDVITATILLDHGASIDAEDHNFRTAFRVALSDESLAVATLLASKNCLLGHFQSALFEIARHSRAIAAFIELLKVLKDRLRHSIDGPLLVREAIERNDDKMLQYLLDAGFDPNTRDAHGLPPIHQAILQNRSVALKILIEHGANLNDYITKGVRYQLSHEVKWHEPLLESLETGATPITTASVMMNPDMLRMLLEAGADPNAVNLDDGGTTLIGVCAVAYLPCAKLLIDFGANVNHRTHDGHSPLYWATYCENVELVKFLVEHGADVNLPTTDEIDRMSALHTSAVDNTESIAEFLIEHGADLEAREIHGKRPVDLAQESGSEEVHELLLAAMEAKGVR